MMRMVIEMIIRNIEEKDYEGKGYVHYQSWIETYTGLMEESYLSKHTLEKCILMAKKYPDRTITAEVNQKVVGFANYGPTRDEDQHSGEVMAIYVLKDYQKQGIGKALMDECMSRLNDYQKIIVWVLSSNQKSIDWYERYGFIQDGNMKKIRVTENYELEEIRLIYHK